MAKGKLNHEVQTFVVQALACFDTPSAVVDAVKREYGVEITRQAVEGYDPGKKAGEGLSEKWRTLFKETREAFLSNTAEIGVAHRAVRLRRLDRLIDRAESMGNMALCAQLMEQAAKEMGNAYTNRREFTGKDGKDLPNTAVPVTIFALPDNGRK